MRKLNIYGEQSKIDDKPTTRLRVFDDHACNFCGLSIYCNTVKVSPRYGSKRVKLLLIGEAPGEWEDREGLAFVGNSGKQLDTLIVEAGVPIEHVGFTNIVRCIPWKDPYEKMSVRPPTDDEIVTCAISYLYNEIRHVNPDVIVALGGTATKFLVDKPTIGRVRGRVFEIKHQNMTYPVIPTYHPASILHGQVRNRQEIIRDLRKAWDVSRGAEFYKDPDTEIINDTYKAIETLYNIIEDHKSGKIEYCAYDIEATGLDPWTEEILGFSVCTSPKKAYFIPLYHKESKVDVRKLMPAFEKFASSVPIVGHNIKFDFVWTWVKMGVELDVVFDTLLGSFLVYGDTRHHDLGGLAQDFLYFSDYEVDLKKFLESLPPAERNYGSIPLKMLGTYGALDAAATLGLAPIFIDRIHTDNLKLPWDLLKESLYVFSEIEINGWPIDTEKLAELKSSYPERELYYLGKMLDTEGALQHIKQNSDPKMADIVDKYLNKGKLTKAELAKLRKICNPNSAMQMRSVMYDYYKDPIIEKEKSKKTGEPSTGEKSVVNAIKTFKNDPEKQDAYKFHENLWVCRKINKAISAYINKIPKHMRPGERPVINFNYKFHGTRTGRFSTADYAIHTTPRKSDIKRLFISNWPTEGGLILDGDYSQWEMRIFAQEAGEDGMLEAFRLGHDIYRYIGSIIYEKPMEAVSDEERQIAKKTALGLIYGEGFASIAEQCLITEDQARDVLERFFRKFPGARSYMERVHDEVRTTGKVRSKIGRIRHFPNIFHNLKKWEIGEIERAAQNFPIQSLASDLTLSGLLSLYIRLRHGGFNSKILGFVHDGIPTDVYPGELIPVMVEFHKAMTTDVVEIYKWLKVPVKADFKIGKTWGSTLEVKDWGLDFMKVEGKRDYFFDLVDTMGKSYEFDHRILKEFEIVEEEFIIGKAYQGYSSDNTYVVGEITGMAPLLT